MISVFKTHLMSFIVLRYMCVTFKGRGKFIDFSCLKTVWLPVKVS